MVLQMLFVFNASINCSYSFWLATEDLGWLVLIVFEALKFFDFFESKSLLHGYICCLPVTGLRLFAGTTVLLNEFLVFVEL